MTHYVYTCHGNDGAPVLYIGSTCDIARRMSEHARASWWPAVTDIGHTAFDSKAQALAAERYLIAALRPTHNVLGVASDGPSAVERKREALARLAEQVKAEREAVA